MTAKLNLYGNKVSAYLQSCNPKGKINTKEIIRIILIILLCMLITIYSE
jgi:hypothetical protein